MPVRNGEDHLAEALDSLLGQTFGDFELLVSDNCSDDGTEEICREVARRDERVRYVRQERNIGAAANYNLVFAQTSGRFFRWAPHDDLAAPTHLEACLGHFADGVALVYPRTMLIDEQGDELGIYEDDLELDSASPARRLVRLARNWNLCNPAVGLVRRSVAERTGLIGPYRSSDLVFLFEVALQGRIIEHPEPLFLRRIHAGSAMQGNGDAADAVSWLDPTAALPRARRWAPWTRPDSTLPLLRHVLGSVARADLPAVERLRIGTATGVAWTARRARVHGGRLKAAALHRAG